MVRSELKNHVTVLMFVNSGNIAFANVMLGGVNRSLTFFPERTYKSKYRGFIIRYSGTDFVMWGFALMVFVCAREKWM